MGPGAPGEDKPLWARNCHGCYGCNMQSCDLVEKTDGFPWYIVYKTNLNLQPNPNRTPTVDGRNPFRTTLKPWESIVCWYLQGNHQGF